MLYSNLGSFYKAKRNDTPFCWKDGLSKNMVLLVLNMKLLSYLKMSILNTSTKYIKKRVNKKRNVKYTSYIFFEHDILTRFSSWSALSTSEFWRSRRLRWQQLLKGNGLRFFSHHVLRLRRHLLSVIFPCYWISHNVPEVTLLSGCFRSNYFWLIGILLNGVLVSLIIFYSVKHAFCYQVVFSLNENISCILLRIIPFCSYYLLKLPYIEIALLFPTILCDEL